MGLRFEAALLQQFFISTMSSMNKISDAFQGFGFANFTYVYSGLNWGSAGLRSTYVLSSWTSLRWQMQLIADWITNNGWKTGEQSNDIYFAYQIARLLLWRVAFAKTMYSLHHSHMFFQINCRKPNASCQSILRPRCLNTIHAYNYIYSS